VLSNINNIVLLVIIFLVIITKVTDVTLMKDSPLFYLLQAFVVFVTMCREAYDDFVRFRRDREVNSQLYKKITKKGTVH